MQYVNTGSGANKGDGDSIRLAFDKINRNFGLFDGGGTGTVEVHNIVANDVTVTGTFLGTSTFQNILVQNTATIDKRLFVGSYLDPNLRDSDTVGIYNGTVAPHDLDVRILNNNRDGYSAVNLTDRLTYDSFIFLHQNAGRGTTEFAAGQNYLYSDSPNSTINIGKYSDIYFWADENHYYNSTLTTTASMFINNLDGSVSINKDLYLNGLSFSITSSGTAYANGIPISGGGAKITDAAPATGQSGSLWYDTIDGRMYVDYNGSWVDTNPQLGLSTATTSTLGGVKIGNGVDVTGDGTISVITYSLSTATTSTLGGVIVDGTSIVINDGIISAPDADPTRLINGIYTATLTSTGTLSLPDVLTVPGVIYQGTAFDGNTYPNTTIRIDSYVNSCSQLIYKNHNNQALASTDIVLLNDQGSDMANYIDMGINSSNYVSTQYGIATPGSGYLYTSNTDMLIGTAGPNTKLVFHAGGTTVNDTVVTMDQYAWTFNRKVVVSVDQPSEMVFLSENKRTNVESSAVFKAANDVGDYIKMGVNSSIRQDGSIAPGESFIYTSETTGTMHIGNKSSINFYANTATGYLEPPTLRIEATNSNVIIDGDVVPYADLMYNLGNTDYRWDTLHAGSVTIDSHVLTINTSGSLTLDGAIVHGVIPAFRVIGGGSTVDIGPATLTNVNFVVDYNQGGHLNTSTGVFTAPQAGIYSVFFNARTSTSNNVLSQAAVVKNSSTNVCFWEVASTSTVGHMGVSGHVMLAMGDTLQANVVAGLINFDASDSWGVALIG